jgi:hypothetical protein
MRGEAMGDPATYTRYAEECKRLAKLMPEEHRRTLLDIAEAWMKLAAGPNEQSNKAGS